MLTDDVYTALDRALAAADRAAARDYPGDSGARQPVHTVYVPADQYTDSTTSQWGARALAAIDEHLPNTGALADLLGLDTAVAAEVLPRVRSKLATEPIEDLRIDFEDGLGPRPDTDEDAFALAAGRALGQTSVARPPFAGIRFKSLEPATRRRGLRTIDLFLTGLLAETPLPVGFALTLPKVTHVDQVTAFAQACTALEIAHGLAAHALRFEVQIETPQAVLAADGTAAVPPMMHAGDGAVSGLHYGTYDYSAALGIAAPYQAMDHPVADHAKAVMQLAAAATGVRLSDGSSNVLPVGSPAEIAEAWRLHARLVRRSLERGYYQGWDLHPLHLVTRYAATYAFYRSTWTAAADRLRAYLDRGNGAESSTLDEPATAQAMAAVLVRGRQCGALDADEVARHGLDAALLDGLYRRRVG